MKKQLKSFGFAFRGIGTAICTEAHLRFHLVAALYVISAAFICGFAPVRMAVLFILSGLVISMELINTALEKVCDLVTTDYHPLVRAAKDICAGAVLAIAIAAVGVAGFFFLDITVFNRLFAFFISRPLCIALLVVISVLAVLFIWKGPAPVINRRKHNKKP
jgi:diacylglycerol kinase